MKTMTIGSLAKRTGIGIETIRYYEREGVLEKPNRREGSRYREFGTDVVKRLTFVLRAKELGFSLKEIKELLSLRAKTKAKCESVKVKAEKKISEIKVKIHDLIEIKRALEELVAVCKSKSPTSECPILDALEQEKAK